MFYAIKHYIWQKIKCIQTFCKITKKIPVAESVNSLIDPERRKQKYHKNTNLGQRVPIKFWNKYLNIQAGEAMYKSVCLHQNCTVMMLKYTFCF